MNNKQMCFFLAIAALFFSISCEKKNDDSDPLKKVVLEGYIFANEPIDDIRLTLLLPYGGEDSIPQPINDADITIFWKGIPYELIPSAGDSGYYYYPGNDLQILEGENYRIEIDYFGKLTSGETVVPPPPTGVILNIDTMEFSKEPPFYIFVSNDSLTVSWDNNNEEYYYVVINNIEQNPNPFYPGFDMKSFVSSFLFTRPTQEDKYEILDYYISNFGKHQVKVYKVNREYVDLFTSLDQDSRTLNEPLTNINNGLGVFAAFNSDTANFYVIEK